MTNLIQLSEQLKGVQDAFLEQQVANPSGTVPPYLVLSELNRRKTLRSQMAQAPASTVAQDVLQQPPPMAPGMGDMDVLGGQQPQVPQAPQGGMPMGGGLAAMAPPMPQGPPAPQRMAGGGLVGTGHDRILGRGNQFWGDPARMAGGGIVRMFAGGGAPVGIIGNRRMGVTPRLSPWEEEEEENGIVRTPDGGWIVTEKGRQFPISPRPKVQFPEWKDPEAIKVPQPELGGFLEQIRALNPRQEGQSVLDRRIGELESQRANIRRPRVGDALMEIGLGGLASKQSALNPLGALGEAGLGAMQNWQRRQELADRTELGITERLAGFEMAKEEQAERARREDLRSASELASRQYGANMVEAQARAQQEAARRNWELDKYKVERGAESDDYRIQSGLEMGALERAMKPYEPTWEEKLAKEKELIEWREKMQLRYAKPTGGLGGYGRSMPQWRINEIAKGLIQGEAQKGWETVPGETAATLADRVGNKLAEQIAGGYRLDHLPGISDMDREAIARAALGYQPDFKTRDKAYGAELEAYIKEQDRLRKEKLLGLKPKIDASGYVRAPGDNTYDRMWGKDR